MSTLPGPEWHPVIGVLAVLVALVALASFAWWLGVLALGALCLGLAVAAFVGEW